MYENHTEEKAALKVEMFNEGEIELMRKTGLGPVFFGESLAGGDLPNMVYLLSAANAAEHKQHWQTFFGHPEWERMKSLSRYKDTVSRVVKTMLAPTAYSQI